MNTYDYKLEYNQINYYNFIYSEGNGSSINKIIRRGQYIQALSNYITAANVFTTESIIINESDAMRMILQIESNFIHSNGEQILLQVGQIAIDKFMNYI